MTKNTMAQVVVLRDGSKLTILYGPFSETEYFEFKEWFESVVNPDWDYDIRPVEINLSATNAFHHWQVSDRV